VIDRVYRERERERGGREGGGERVVRVNPKSDAIFCTLLAQNAVHGAMAGYTCFTTGLVCNRTVYIPIPAIVENSPRYSVYIYVYMYIHLHTYILTPWPDTPAHDQAISIYIDK